MVDLCISKTKQKTKKILHLNLNQKYCMKLTYSIIVYKNITYFNILSPDHRIYMRMITVQINQRTFSYNYLSTAFRLNTGWPSDSDKTLTHKHTLRLFLFFILVTLVSKLVLSWKYKSYPGFLSITVEENIKL